jgi:hypothetical protein
MGLKFDFSGWATKNDLTCSDGRTIRKDAFKDNDGKKVPLVWNHQHKDPTNVIGHAILENRADGVYAYCCLNDTEMGRTVKSLVNHGDVEALSIYANKLTQRGGDVLHGAIRELSIVIAGANPGAFIDSVFAHGESSEEEAIIYTGEDVVIAHSDCKPKEEKEKKLEHSKEPTKEPAEAKTIKDAFDSLNEEQKTVAYAIIAKAVSDATGEDDDDEEEAESEDVEHSDTGKTIKEIFDSFTDEQKTALYVIIGQAVSDSKVEHSDNQTEDEDEDGDEIEDEDIKGGNPNMLKHNVFDQESDTKENTLSHSDMEAIFTDAKRLGSLKDSVLQHGIENIDSLFPDAKTLNTPPEFIKRDDTWVAKFMNGVHHTPFSRIKSQFANLTESEARAKGYMKGNLKVEEVFTLLKRTTTPTTIYKKQKLDRDDVIDIVDFDVVAWLKIEMRMMLEEEIARAALIGDGRLSSSDDKINEQNVRPIWTDDNLYTIKETITVAANATADQKAKAFIHAAVKCRKNYKGSGNPTMWTTEDVLTDCLLMEDTQGRVIYETEEKLRIALRVKEIVTVPVMEDLSRTVSNVTRTLKGIILNPNDYNIGADKGGAVNMFDDFDIDYNQHKYLMETRCSGALIKPYSAIALEEVTAVTSAG